MTLIICPRCQRVTAHMEGNSDIIHKCNSGNLTLDQEDIFDLNGENWNWRGVHNQLSAKAKIMGADFEGVTRRGYRKSSYRQEAHEEFINLK